MELIPITRRDLLESAGIFYTKNTLYKMHSVGDRPELFIKVGRKLFINVREWKKYLEQEEKRAQARAEKIKELKGE